jgi:hypothetical protein
MQICGISRQLDTFICAEFALFTNLLVTMRKRKLNEPYRGQRKLVETRDEKRIVKFG